jgi:hypothetical protein
MALGTLLTIVFQDALIESWAEGNPGASEILDEGGIEALKSSSIALPAFVPVVVVMFIVLLGLLAVLRVFLREGYEWARVSLAAVALLIGLAAGLIAFRESPPLVFVAICVAALVVDVAFLDQRVAGVVGAEHRPRVGGLPPRAGLHPVGEHGTYLPQLAPPEELLGALLGALADLHGVVVPTHLVPPSPALRPRTDPAGNGVEVAPRRIESNTCSTTRTVPLPADKASRDDRERWD